MKTKLLLSTILVLTLTLAACAPKAVTAPKQVPAPATKIPVPKATIAPTKAPAKASPTAKPSVSPTSKPVSTPTQVASTMNQITVQDQAISSNSVLVSRVDAMQPGWVVIYTDQNGQPGTVLGHAAVPAGISNDVKVTIDTAKETSKMIVMLHIDAGKIGTFEYPGPDMPVKNGSSTVMAVFSKKA